jgi:hypothetical protein
LLKDYLHGNCIAVFQSDSNKAVGAIGHPDLVVSNLLDFGQRDISESIFFKYNLRFFRDQNASSEKITPIIPNTIKKYNKSVSNLPMKGSKIKPADNSSPQGITE